jgi:hypothetical protein
MAAEGSQVDIREHMAAQGYICRSCDRAMHKRQADAVLLLRSTQIRSIIDMRQAAWYNQTEPWMRLH